MFCDSLHVDMKYFIGYELQGEARDYHIKLSDNLVSRFNLRKLSEYIPPHITLKAPFETESIGEVNALLEQFSHAHRKSLLYFRDFGNFSPHSVYLKVFAPVETLKVTSELKERLARISWMTFEDLEKKSIFHSSVARRIPEESFEDLWKYVSSLPQPDIKARFDNVSIFVRDGDHWKTNRLFSFQKKGARSMDRG